MTEYIVTLRCAAWLTRTRVYAESHRDALTRVTRPCTASRVMWASRATVSGGGVTCGYGVSGSAMTGQWRPWALAEKRRTR